MLGSAGDGGLHLRLAQVGLDLADHLGQELVSRRRPLGDHPHDLIVDLGMQGREREVLELPLDGVHAQPVGQGCVDVEGLAGGAFLALLRHVAQRAHVVEPVGELDHEHPDVARHRHDHLADGLGLGRVAVLHLVELGHAVDHPGDLVAEVLPALLERVRRVLDGVVQQRRHQGRLRHADARQDRGDRQRVGDVGVAALAHLGAVHLLGGDVRALDQRQVGLGVVGPDGAEERLEHRVRGLGARAHPRQAGSHAATAGHRPPRERFRAHPPAAAGRCVPRSHLQSRCGSDAGEGRHGQVTDRLPAGEEGQLHQHRHADGEYRRTARPVAGSP